MGTSVTAKKGEMKRVGQINEQANYYFRGLRNKNLNVGLVKSPTLCTLGAVEPKI